ncbi:MAG: SDR family oxidoreductase [Deltaproteobacteria bacterium]|nr:SDR family oxidoreductase [Deltaproteobacteria bacterium]
MQRYEGRVALVTGAASGIGRATAERLAREGARVLCADVQAAALAETVEAVRSRGAEAAACACDVGDESQVRAAVREAVQRYGGLHVLANIAGILRFKNTHEVSLDDWNRVLAINLTGTFLFCREAITHFLGHGGGAIVNVSSSAAIQAHAWTAAYTASKGGVLALSNELAIEYGRQGVRVNCVCPGGVKTPIHEEFAVPPGADATLVRRILPFGGFGRPEDVADAIAFLGSDDARFINGTMLRIDGGACS